MLFGEEKSSLESQGMKFGLGVAIGIKSPLFAAGSDGKFSYNDAFLNPSEKPLGIDDFLFGIPLKFNWIWQNEKKIGVGVQMDLAVSYMPTGDYSQLIDSVTGAVSSLIPGQENEGATVHLEHGIRADLSALFVFQASFFRIGVGPGITLDMNASQTHDARKALEGDPVDGRDLITCFERVGITDFSGITDGTTFNAAENLSTLQKMAFLGLGLDPHVKINLEFMLGKHLMLGASFMVNFNAQLGLWQEGADFSTNMDAIFNPDMFKGDIGFHVVWMF